MHQTSQNDVTKYIFHFSGTGGLRHYLDSTPERQSSDQDTHLELGSDSDVLSASISPRTPRNPKGKTPRSPRPESPSTPKSPNKDSTPRSLDKDPTTFSPNNTQLGLQSPTKGQNKSESPSRRRSSIMSDKKGEMDASVAKRLQYLENALKAKENKVL